MTERIETAGDPRLEPYRNLPTARRDRTSERFVAESEFTVRRLLESPFEVESLLATQAASQRLEALVPSTVQLFVASKTILSEIVGYRFHSGVLACGKRRRLASTAQITTHDARAQLLVALSQVVDADNVGSIVRSAAAFGADAVLIDPRCADAFSRRAIRVSMGNVFRIPIVECENLGVEFAALANDHGYTLFAAVTDCDAMPLRTIEPTGRDVLLFGGEGYGLSDELVTRCSRRVTIPMDRGMDSLNVAVASAVTLYHFSTYTQR